jgi:branched-subunit amino acid aminotransferase/4-amino-4-deoxychorismate lyase
MYSYYNENTILYIDGEFKKATAATTDLYSQSLHYGYAVFEGIRAYKTASGEVKIFKAKEHFDRFKRSCELIHIPYKFDNEALIAACYKVLEEQSSGSLHPSACFLSSKHDIKSCQRNACTDLRMGLGCLPG